MEVLPSQEWLHRRPFMFSHETQFQQHIAFLMRPNLLVGERQCPKHGYFGSGSGPRTVEGREANNCRALGTAITYSTGIYSLPFS